MERIERMKETKNVVCNVISVYSNRHLADTSIESQLTFQNSI